MYDEDWMFYRVMDDSSRACFDDDGNITAGALIQSYTYQEVDAVHRDDVDDFIIDNCAHFDWGYRGSDTPLISAFGPRGYGWAVQEAERRVRVGRRNVQIVTIVIPRRRHRLVQFRSVQKMINKGILNVPDRAVHMAEDEFVFLYKIPSDFVGEIENYD